MVSMVSFVAIVTIVAIVALRIRPRKSESVKVTADYRSVVVILKDDEEKPGF